MHHIHAVPLYADDAGKCTSAHSITGDTNRGKREQQISEDYIYIPLRLSWMGVHVLHLVSWAMQSDSCTAVFKTCGQCAITGEREWVGFPLLFPFIHLELVFLKAPFSQNAIAYASAFLAATERWHQSRSSRLARAFRTAYQSD